MGWQPIYTKTQKKICSTDFFMFENANAKSKISKFWTNPNTTKILQ